MIEYTITPISYDQKNAFLEVEIVPVDPLRSRQTIVVGLPPEVLEEVVAMVGLEERKVIIRREILKYNDMLQHNWDNEIAIASTPVPQELLDQLGIPGTTPVTAAEVS